MKVLHRLEGWVLSACMLLMTALMFTNITARALFGVSLAMTQELSRFAIVTITFTGLSHAAVRGRHIRMTALFDLWPPHVQRWAWVTISLLTSLLLSALAVYAIAYAQTLLALGTRSPVLGVPRAAMALIATLGLSLGALQYLALTWLNLTRDGHVTDALLPSPETPPHHDPQD